MKLYKWSHSKVEASLKNNKGTSEWNARVRYNEIFIFLKNIEGLAKLYCLNQNKILYEDEILFKQSRFWREMNEIV